MRGCAWLLAAIVAGCGGGGATVGSSSVPPNGGSAGGGDGSGTAGGGGMPGGGGGGGMPGGGGGGMPGGGGGGGGMSGGGSGGGGGVVTPCSETPVVVASAFQPVTSDGRYVYGWSTQQIARMPVGGGALETIVGGIDVSTDWDIVVDDRYVFWTWLKSDGSGITLLRAPKDGGSATVMHQGSGQVEIVADAGAIYSITTSGIARIDKDSTATTVLTSTIGAPVAVTDSDLFFFTTHDGEAWHPSVHRMAKSGGPDVEIGWWQAYGDHLPDLAVYDATAIFAYDFGRIVRIGLADGAVATLYDPQRDPPIEGFGPGLMAIDDAGVYWTTTPDEDDEPPYSFPRYYLSRIDKDGANPTGLDIRKSGMGRHLAVAGDSVYYDVDGMTWRRCER